MHLEALPFKSLITRVSDAPDSAVPYLFLAQKSAGIIGGPLNFLPVTPGMSEETWQLIARRLPQWNDANVHIETTVIGGALNCESSGRQASAIVLLSL